MVSWQQASNFPHFSQVFISYKKFHNHSSTYIKFKPLEFIFTNCLAVKLLSNSIGFHVHNISWQVHLGNIFPTMRASIFKLLSYIKILHWLETKPLNGSPADLAIFTTFIFHFHRMLCPGAVAIQQLCESIQLCKVSNWNYVSGGGELRTLTVVHSAPEYFHCKINFIRRHRGPGSIYYISPILK